MLTVWCFLTEQLIKLHGLIDEIPHFLAGGISSDSLSSSILRIVQVEDGVYCLHNALVYTCVCDGCN